MRKRRKSGDSRVLPAVVLVLGWLITTPPATTPPATTSAVPTASPVPTVSSAPTVSPAPTVAPTPASSPTVTSSPPATSSPTSGSSPPAGSSAAPSPAPASTPLYRVGGIGCDGHPHQEQAGTVTLTRDGGSLRVDVEVSDTLYPSRTFTVEAWEEAPGCYPDNALRVPGVGLSTNSSGSGSTSFTLALPWSRLFPDGSTVVLGDGQGSESLVVVLDRDNSTGAGDSYAAGPIRLDPGGQAHADFTTTPEESGTDIRFDASASTVPDGATARYRWDFDNDGAYDEESTTPVVRHTYPDSAERQAALTVVPSQGAPDTVTKAVAVPADTVVVLLRGIEAFGVTPKESAYKLVTEAAAFRDLLNRLGCTDLAEVDNVTKRCNTTDRARLHWSPYSYRGPNGQAAPLTYGGADTWPALSATSAHLDRQIREIGREHPGANVVLVGFSEGGTVAARWAADTSNTSTPIVTIDSPLYGFWPEDRGSVWPEDILNYCGISVPGNKVAAPGPDWTFSQVCTRWDQFGFRSPVSYDWRAGRSFGEGGQLSRAVPLQLFSATNLNDLVAPPWWALSPLADGNRITTCSSLADGHHSCALHDAGVLTAAKGVVDASLAAAKHRERPDVAQTRAGWGTSLGSQWFDGHTATVTALGGFGRIVSVGHFGIGDGAAAGRLTCTWTSASPARSAPLTVTDWTARSYVVFWRPPGVNILFRSRVRVLPYGNGDTYSADVTGNDSSLLLTPDPCRP
ncbi:PKD domain-containing protein [Nonomuraea sp. NPDC050540]|uniref:PKD domain-containing protein n=1 Tax=Nonomuraea sp. NPDC050540 TaxID=3364367 RepID=UPI00378BA0E9